MNFTSSEWILIIGAVSVAIVNIIVALKTLQKTAVIEGHVNSERTKLNEQLIHRQTEIQILRDSIAERDKTAAVLAQAVSNKNLSY